MTNEERKELVETSRHFMELVASEDSLRNHGYNATAEIIGVVPRLLDQIEADDKRIAELETALRQIAEPRLGGGEWAASVARQCLTKHLADNAKVDDLELPTRLKNHLGLNSPAIIVLDILADKKHKLWGNISHKEERIMREIAKVLSDNLEQR